MSRIFKPGTVSFMEVQHDSWCPTLTSGLGNDCQCTPTTRLHSDEERYIRNVIETRKARRRVAREADKAMRRAARKK